MRVLAEHGKERIEKLNAVRVLALGLLGGSFITTGALLAMLLGAGARTEGSLRLLEGFGFSVGFFFVILSGAVLFTETNVVIPAVLLRNREPVFRVLRFWVLALTGNALGALLIGQAIAFAIELSPATQELLSETVATKTVAVGAGGVAWWSVFVSGILANWLVGMAAFFATMGRTIIGKYVPVFLAVTAFVAAGFQHSPANMGFFSLEYAFVGGVDWSDLLLWNLVPAGLGNVIGGGVAVALLLTWAYAGPSRKVSPPAAETEESAPTSTLP